jgi:two-component system KDP operon response regulator KdpE
LGLMNHGAAFSTPWRTGAAPQPSAGCPRIRGIVLVAGSHSQKRLEVRTTLETEGYDVAETSAPDQTMREACSGEYDLLILDSAIAGIGPYELCRGIRSRSDLGIIVLRRDEHQLAGSDVLNAGADDFIPSTFVAGELLARVRAILRRVPRPAAAEQLVSLPDRTIDLKSRKVTGPHGRVNHLTPKEFLVLKYLLAHADQPRTHQNLAQAVWQRNAEGDVEYVRAVIGQLRRKLEPDPEHPRYILTERAFGYRLRPPQSGPSRRIDIPATAPSK